MGRDLAEAFPVARHLFEEVDDALGQHLGRLMFQGPDEELVLTENAQPALMAVSMAVVLVLREEGGLDLGNPAVSLPAIRWGISALPQRAPLNLLMLRDC